MNVFNEVCSVFDILISLYSMIFIAKYVYYEKIYMTKKEWIILSIIVLAMNGILEFYNFEEIQVLAMLFTFYSIIFLSRKRKRIRGAFLFIPIMGIISSLWIMISTIFTISLKTSLSAALDNDIYSFFASLITLFILLGFGKLRKNWSKKYFGKININFENFENFELTSAERNIISCNGFVLFLLFALLANIHDIEILKPYEWGIMLLYIIFSMLMLTTLFVMIKKAVSTNYYKVLSQINEHYLEAQLNHFESYRKSQIETKRIRHDMKNHFLCMRDLYDNGEFEELGQYIHELSDVVMNINKEIYIGNDIADAIINEKNEIAKTLGIEINTEGSLSGITCFAPIDICTIFANALDNSIEALKYLKRDNLVINISVKKHKNYILISFINPVNEEKALFYGSKYKTSKADKDNHGFGLENIKLTAEKYNGHINCSIIDYENMGRAFVTEVILKI